jgi:hypothetical protein
LDYSASVDEMVFKEGASLSAGVQVYPFELQLSAGLLSSVSYCGASVTYVISAECVSSKNWSAIKFADAYFNVYGAETKFKLPLRLRGPIFRIRKVVFEVVFSQLIEFCRST